jgi:hypothetical protein
MPSVRILRDAVARWAQRARLSASHHGTCGSERTPPFNSRTFFLGPGGAYDPEKWKPVFRKDHMQL